MKWAACVGYVLVWACVAGLAQGANPFYVDRNSVKKETYQWTMKLNNRQGGIGDGDNPEIKQASVLIESLDENVLHLKIVDASQRRFEAPILFVESGKNFNKKEMTSMGFTYNEDPFGFKIVAPRTGDVVVEMSASKGSTMQFQDKFLEMGLWYNSHRIYGVGERTTEEFELCSNRDECLYTSWGKDVACPFDDGGGGGKSAYGQQPFYLIHFEGTTKFMGVLSLNSNDQDTLIKKLGGPIKVTHKIIGGVFNFYFFYPGTAEEVLKRYHEVIGRPYIAPFWSLGYHQCRYGWPNLNKVKDVLARFEQKDLPLEVLWGDIDYMDRKRDFTVDPVNYAGLGEFVKEKLHSMNIYYVPIIDAGLVYDVNDKYYKMGEKYGAFIKSAKTKKTLIGQVWPGKAVFMSWYHPRAKEVWSEGLKDLHANIGYDGIWLDMNEIANFCRGECPPNWEKAQTTRMLRGTPDPHDPKEFDNLPYRPGNQDIVDKTVSMTGYHYSDNDDDDRMRKEYNTHSLWPLFEAKATHEFFEEKLNVRPFILTRANFPGSGLFASKWLGDNSASWEYMRASIPGLYNFQLFGMPLSGADACGFMGSTNEELCLRWMQMASFYPFTRNHNDIHSNEQEPYVWDSVATATRNAIRQKYSILWYYYTKLYEVSLYGGTLMRPLFFEWPEDKQAYAKTKYMFLIGPSILIPPVLHERSDKTYPYCPNEHWYNLLDFKKVFSYKPGQKEGEQITLQGGKEYVNVLLRGGSIIPYQDALGSKVRRTAQLRYMPLNMVVGPDHDGKAAGTMITDAGNSVHPIQKKEYRYLSFSLNMPSKKMKVAVTNDYSAKPMKFEEFNRLTILGAGVWKNMRSACIRAKTQDMTISGSYNIDNDVLTFRASSAGLAWRDITSIDFDTSC